MYYEYGDIEYFWQGVYQNQCCCYIGNYVSGFDLADSYEKLSEPDYLQS